jgi:DNA polymerase III gamma/tau subunit
LRNICSKESVQIDETSLALIAKKAEGSMRDSQSLLDQVIAYCGQQVKAEDIAQLFGIIDQEIFFACTDAMVKQDVAKGLALSEQIYTTGYHLGEFLERLSEHLSNILMTRVTNSTAHLFGLDGYLDRYKQAATQLSEIEILRCVQMITDTQLKLNRISNPRVLLEMLLLKMIQLPSASAISGSSNRAENRDDDGLKKKPQPFINETVPPAVSAPPAEAGVAVIPQIAPAPASGEHASRSTPDAPRPARGSLFDLGALPSIQKVPVLQAKEAALPKLTNVADAQAALEKIQQCWPHILEQVKTQRISLGAFLELGVPTSLADGTLEICFDQGSGFQINSVNNQKTFIQQIITAETGYRVRLVCRKDESNTLHEHRAQIQKLSAQNLTTPANVAATVSAIAPSNEAATAASKEPVGTPVNGAAKNANGEPQLHPPAAAPATLNELYQAFPAAKKLVEALDGELI